MRDGLDLSDERAKRDLPRDGLVRPPGLANVMTYCYNTPRHPQKTTLLSTRWLARRAPFGEDAVTALRPIAIAGGRRDQAGRRRTPSDQVTQIGRASCRERV